MASTTIARVRTRRNIQAIRRNEATRAAIQRTLVYSFEPCSNPGCFQLHVPAATGSDRCLECSENRGDR